MDTKDRDEHLVSHEEHHAAGNLMDSKTSHLDDILHEKLEKAFHQQTAEHVHHLIAKITSEYEPIDLAYAASHLPTSERFILYENLADINAKIIFIINTDSRTQIAILWHINDAELKKLIEGMAPDEAVDVLEGISERRYRRIMDLIDPKKATRIKEIEMHSLNTAGRLMTNEFFAFTMDVTIGEAAEKIRNTPSLDPTRSVFITNELGELKGYVTGRNLIISKPDTPLRQVMRPVIHTVTVDATREEVVDIAERYKISSLPVLDDQGSLVGIVSLEDVVEAIEDIADDTIARMAGTAEKVSEHQPAIFRFFSRSPWLLVTLCAGIINGMVMSAFSERVGTSLTFILFFVPLITGFSGNIGIQCSTVLVRSMATGILSSGNKREAVLKEIALGVSIGLIFGSITGGIVYVLDYFGIASLGVGPANIAIMVGVGLIGSSIAGTLLGVFSPLLFARIGVDPAIASGPIITSCNDFLSMSIYFLIALALGAVLL